MFSKESESLSYTWTDVFSGIVSTSSASADLTSQPMGDYSLLVTDGNNCFVNYGPISIDSVSGPPAPAVSNSIYCLGDISSGLNVSGIGSSLVFFTNGTVGYFDLSAAVHTCDRYFVLLCVTNDK